MSRFGVDRQTFVSDRLSVNDAGSATGEVYSSSYEELVASTNRQTDFIAFTFKFANSTGLVHFDIGVGESGSEVTIVEKLLLNINSFVDRTVYTYPLPVCIPAGSRVAVRAYIKGTSTAKQIYYQLHLYSGSAAISSSYSRCEYLGDATIDPGAVANTKGSYSTIVASTAENYAMILCKLFCTDTTMEDSHFLVDLAIGAASSEVIILPDKHVYVDAAYDIVYETNPQVLAFQIPAGTRLSARSQSSITDATNRVLGMQIWGFR